MIVGWSHRNFRTVRSGENEELVYIDRMNGDLYRIISAEKPTCDREEGWRSRIETEEECLIKGVDYETRGHPCMKKITEMMREIVRQSEKQGGLVGSKK